MLAAKWSKLQLDDGRFANLETQGIAPLRAFCRRSIDTLAVGWGALLPRKTIGDVLADTYERLFGPLDLQPLPDIPQFVFNATHLQAGRLVSIHKVRSA